MPCREFGDRDCRLARNSERADLEAMLCAIVTTIEAHDRFRDVIAHVNWNKAGLTEQTFNVWWDKHKAKDRRRRAEENKIAQQEALKVQAISKLTGAERQALGL